MGLYFLLVLLWLHEWTENCWTYTRGGIRRKFCVTGAVALILIGIGVVIGLAICRKRSTSPAKDGPDDFTIPTYVSAQRIEPRIRCSGDNRRSQRTSLYIEENRNGVFSISLFNKLPQQNVRSKTRLLRTRKNNFNCSYPQLHIITHSLSNCNTFIQ